ncbi:MAG: response regulator transcription factor [Chloroflexi bacterium]|nr:response regulator transcription factor [Chloroflexota bacterium]
MNGTQQTTHILVVEDDPAVAGSLVEGLRRDGYVVTWKSSGAEGVAFACEAQPHLIILDVRLPDGSGFDVCRQMRRLGLRQPVLMLTVRSDEIDKVLGLEMGADDYMTKPYSLRELLSRVRALLRRAYDYDTLADSDGHLLYVNDLVLDRDRALVRRGDQQLNLTPTEFRLLTTLVQHRGQALTRAQIVAAVWGYADDLDSERSVNVHIRRLREKVELDPSQPTLILTVPGVGYRLAG